MKYLKLFIIALVSVILFITFFFGQRTLIAGHKTTSSIDDVIEKNKNSLSKWKGTWKEKNKNSTLEIKSLTKESFKFKINTQYKWNTGEIEGEAKIINSSKAKYKSNDNEPCILEFYFKNNFVKIVVKSSGCSQYGGLNVSFEGNYIKKSNTVRVQFEKFSGTSINRFNKKIPIIKFFSLDMIRKHVNNLKHEINQNNSGKQLKMKLDSLLNQYGIKKVSVYNSQKEDEDGYSIILDIKFHKQIMINKKKINNIYTIFYSYGENIDCYAYSKKLGVVGIINSSYTSLGLDVLLLIN